MGVAAAERVARRIHRGQLDMAGAPYVDHLARVAARVAELARPTLGDGETYTDLLADPSAFEDFDIERARTQGYGFARLQRLALEHLLGTRGA